MSDVWERLHGGAPTSLEASDDPDRDGFTNLDESRAGTDPFDPDSFLGIDLARVGAGLEASWRERPGKRYALQRSSDAQLWHPVEGVALSPPAAPPQAVGGGYDFLDFWHRWAGDGAGLDSEWTTYYEVDGSAPGRGRGDDPDGDGQANWAESYAGTNPFEAAAKLLPTLDPDHGRLLLEYVGDDGLLRHDLELAVDLGTLYSTSSTAGTPFEPHAAELDATFFGALVDEGTSPSRIRSHVAGAQAVRRSDGYAPPPAAGGGDHLLGADGAEFHDGGDGVLVIEWSGGGDSPGYVVRIRPMLGDWYFAAPLTATARAAAHPSAETRSFYRVVARDVAGGGVDGVSLWERTALMITAPEGDWDGDGAANGVEGRAGTNPLAWDSDGDGWIDSFEIEAGGDAASPPAPPYVATGVTGLVVFTPHAADRYGEGGE